MVLHLVHRLETVPMKGGSASAHGDATDPRRIYVLHEAIMHPP